MFVYIIKNISCLFTFVRWTWDTCPSKASQPQILNHSVSTSHLFIMNKAALRIKLDWTIVPLSLTYFFWIRYGKISRDFVRFFFEQCYIIQFYDTSHKLIALNCLNYFKGGAIFPSLIYLPMNVVVGVHSLILLMGLCYNLTTPQQ